MFFAEALHSSDMRYYTFLLTFFIVSRRARCFWPPAYKVDLNDKKVFVIASEETDYEEENEDEMIGGKDLAEFESLAEDEDKFKSLHSHVESYNKRAAITATEFARVLPNFFLPNLEDVRNFVEEAKPFVVGFKNELDNYDFDDLEERVFEIIRSKRDASDDRFELRASTTRKSRGITEPKEVTKPFEIGKATNPNEESSDKEIIAIITNKGVTTETRETNSDSEEEDYNYEELKSEYYEQIENSKLDNKTLNYTENGEPEETANDAIKKIIDFKIPKNCTREELTQFGAKALECLAYDYKNAKNEKSVRKILSRTWLVVRIWVCIYLCIALPCWCQKGWCCCCLNCKYFKPKETIMNAKKYYAENPPGILTEYEKVDDNKKESKTTEFKPTLFELEAYERFESAIRNL